MASDDGQDLTRRLEGLGIAPASLEEDDRGTVVTRLPLDAADIEPTVVQPDFSHLSRALDVGEPLGRGGQSEVVSAVQRALRRQVAIKRLRYDKQDEQSAARLLMEARVQGALEHPAVVPIYMLGADAEARPEIVMRNVQGRVWSTYVAPGGLLSAPAGETDALAWHLGVLLRVCSAVEYAHGKGILHRDLKLSNVMIDTTGDPYVLDWGLAAACTEDCDVALPRCWEEYRVVGTASYMAPEMASVEPQKIGPRTDVYLLGACLHVLLVGAPRHEGATLIERLAKAYGSRPYRYPPRVPSALGQIANRATSKDPADRFASAAEFRMAVREFLRRPPAAPPPTADPDPPPRGREYLHEWPPRPYWHGIVGGLAAGLALGLLLSAAC